MFYLYRRLNFLVPVFDKPYEFHFGDYFLIIFGGQIPENKMLSIDMVRPAYLLLFYIFIFAIMHASYFQKDIEGFGQHIILRMQSRKLWLVQKLIFIFVNVVLFYLSTIFLLYLVTLITGAIPNLNVDNNFMEFYSSLIDTDGYNSIQYLPIFYVLQVPLVLLAFALLQMCFELIWGSVFAFLAVVVVSFISILKTSSIFLLNDVMTFRTGLYFNDEISQTKMIIVPTIYIAITLLVLFVYVSRMNILSREEV